jgi:hypothetical protein
MKTDTPRTDKFTSTWDFHDEPFEAAEHARTLERELTAAREELSEWSILNGWGGAPEIINDFIKGQQTRIYHAQNLEEELTAACQEIDMLKSKYADHHAEAERLTFEINAVTDQRDRLKDAIITHRAKAFPLTGEDFDQELWQALTAVKGGSDDRPILRHNGVGIADMYQPGELEKELRSMTGAEPQNA